MVDRIIIPRRALFKKMFLTDSMNNSPLTLMKKIIYLDVVICLVIGHFCLSWISI